MPPFLLIESECLPLRKVAPGARSQSRLNDGRTPRRETKASTRSHARAMVAGAIITYIQELELAPSARQQL